MNEELQIEEIKFNQELYEKNIQDHDFSNKITDGVGDDVDENN